jgi:hypothetical protein
MEPMYADEVKGSDKMPAVRIGLLALKTIVLNEIVIRSRGAALYF